MLLAAPVLVGFAFNHHFLPHLLGIGLLGIAVTAAAVVSARLGCTDAMREPDLAADVERHGVAAVLVVYWLRWRAQNAGCPQQLCIVREPRAPTAELVVVVQCESFADPAEMIAPISELPAPCAARRMARRAGRLLVSGFGAYTMRTEYGVLAGIEEAALGFWCYDPYLTAGRDTAGSLPARFAAAGYRCTFLHLHDLRFYERDRLMPTFGFDTVIGAERFGPPSPGAYVSDAEVGFLIEQLAGDRSRPVFIYVVTMENHGPWSTRGIKKPADAVTSYLQHLRNGDRLLGTLRGMFAGGGRPGVLAFFGDHRPSIPGASMPGGARHTPYVVLQFDENGATDAPHSVDLTPAGLHHEILAAAGL